MLNDKNFSQTPLFLIIALFFFSTNVYSQVDELTTRDLRDIVQRDIVPKIDKTEIIGIPYVFENFKNGSLELLNGSKTEVIVMNYNVHENRIEYQDGNVILAIDLNRIKNFEFYEKDRVRKFKNGYSSQRLDPTEFVEVLAEGKVTLLVKHEVSLQENIASYGSATKKNEYIDNQRFYIHKDNETNRIKRLRERNVLRELDNSRDLKNYIKNNNLDMSSIEDVARLITYYNRQNES